MEKNHQSSGGPVVRAVASYSKGYEFNHQLYFRRALAILLRLVSALLVLESKVA